MTFGPRNCVRQRLAQHLERPAHVIGIGPPDPLDPDALYRIDDRVVSLPMLVRCAGGWNVLTAGRRGVAVVDNHGKVVVLIEDGIAYAARQPVVPKTAVTHDRDRTLAAIRAERRRARSPQAVAHDAVAHVEGRECRKRMAADVRADVQRPDFLLQKLHCREERPLRTSRAQTRRARRHQRRQFGGGSRRDDGPSSRVQPRPSRRPLRRHAIAAPTGR